ncbi:MAG: hypothetical protein H0X71_00465 [Rubrobacter sp.]|nr:hypothetical protein [Rubrobacter sp.]
MAEEKDKPRVGLQQAVSQAIREVRDLYEAQGFDLSDLMLEEVKRSGGVWEVTVGFTRPNTATSDMSTIGRALARPGRAYKRVKINADTGEFLEMEIRELQSQSTSQ